MYSKKGLDYFSYPCVEGRAERLIRRAFGCEGVGVTVRLYQLIFSENGYFAVWDDDAEFEFSCENSVSQKTLHAIIEKGCDYGIFDRRLLDEYSILSGVGIQELYFSAVSRRTRVEAVRDYLLIEPPRAARCRWQLRESDDIDENAQSAPSAINGDFNGENRRDGCNGKENLANTENILAVADVADEIAYITHGNVDILSDFADISGKNDGKVAQRKEKKSKEEYSIERKRARACVRETDVIYNAGAYADGAGGVADGTSYGKGRHEGGGVGRAYNTGGTLYGGNTHGNKKGGTSYGGKARKICGSSAAGIEPSFDTDEFFSAALRSSYERLIRECDGCNGNGKAKLANNENIPDLQGNETSFKTEGFEGNGKENLENPEKITAVAGYVANATKAGTGRSSAKSENTGNSGTSDDATAQRTGNSLDTVNCGANATAPNTGNVKEDKNASL